MRAYQFGSLLLGFTCTFTQPASAALLEQQGSFVDMVDSLKSVIFAKDSNLYVIPTVQERNAFAALAADLWVAISPADLQALVPAAAALGYDVVQFEDNGTIYFGLRETLINNAQQRGWGSYFVRQGPRRDALIQVPHPLNDTNTPEIGARVFVQTQARGFLTGAEFSAQRFG